MKHTAAAFLACLTSTLAADEWKLPEEKIDFKQGPGADLVQASCIMCHSHEYITTQPRFTRDQWKASVTKMLQKYGAPVASEKVEPLLDYLAQSYGKPAK